MLAMLSDNNSYEQLVSDPLPTLQKKTKDLLRSWNSKRYLHKNKKVHMFHPYKFTQTDAMIARIYGLPKIHKVGAPLRPVVSCIGFPTYFLSQQIDFILNSSISKPASHIKNSFELKEKLENIEISDPAIYYLVLMLSPFLQM